MEHQGDRLQAIPKEEEEVERNQRPNTMEDFWRHIIQEEYSAVRQPAIEANNFELKPALITMCSNTSSQVTPLKIPMSIWGDS